MKFPPFALERYFAEHEFSAPYLLCSSDCESMPLKDLLALEPGAHEAFGELWLGYTESLGAPTLREAIAKLYDKVAAEQVLVHTGAQEAIFNFGHAVLDVGDHVIVHTPCYQSLAEVPKTIGCRVSRWEANPKDGWEMDVSALRQLLTPKTRAIILNSPHNPTGYQMGSEKFAAVVAVAREARCLLFVDEVYRGLEHDAADRLPAACDVYENAISLGVMSKSLGLPGLRIGWIATQNRAVFEKMAQFKDYTTICNSAPSEFLSTLALRHSQKILTRNRELAQANLRLLDAFFTRHDEQFDWVKPKVGCIAFPRLRSGDADVFAETILRRTGVLLAPGSRFDYDRSYFRMGFGRKNFSDALGRFEDALSPTAR